MALKCNFTKGIDAHTQHEKEFFSISAALKIESYRERKRVQKKMSIAYIIKS